MTEVQSSLPTNLPQMSRQSRLGKRPIPVPKGVKVAIDGSTVDVQGPKGKLSRVFPEGIHFILENDTVYVTSDARGADAPRLQGLGRALVASMVKGCAEGYEKVLELKGTGYRCEMKGKTITFNLGLSHQCVYELPESMSGTIPGDSKGTVLILSSADKEVLGQVAAAIKNFRPPEPYGGKGVHYRGEQIRRKAGKSGKKK